MALKTDYKDYIPPEEGKKYKVTANSDGSSSIEDITQYEQIGDTWSAKDINETNIAINQLNFSYSENETWTGKYWTDGRKIYTKLVMGTVPSTGTTISIPHGVSGIGSFRVYDWVKMNNYQCPLFNFNLPANNFNWLGFDETNLIFLRGGDGVWSGSPIVAAILYTKAADEPISI